MSYDPNTKIILISDSYDQNVLQIMLMRSSFYISNPFDFNSVLDSIKGILESNLGHKSRRND